MLRENEKKSTCCVALRSGRKQEIILSDLVVMSKLFLRVFWGKKVTFNACNVAKSAYLWMITPNSVRRFYAEDFWSGRISPHLLLRWW